MNDQKLRDIVNQSGFPLQIGIGNQIDKTHQQHGWRTLSAEHSWRNDVDKTNGFIDIIAEKSPHNVGHTNFLLIECKRVQDSSWIFLVHNPDNNRKHATAWLTYNEGGHIRSCWGKTIIYPDSPESSYCVILGEDSKSKPMLERIAGELVSATEGFASEHGRYFKRDNIFCQRYFSVIVTTANLKVCNFDPNNVSLSNGKIDTTQFTDAPYVRFRKQLSSRPYTSQTDSFANLIREKEHTVFVVQAKSLIEFLSTFEVD